MYCPLCKTGQGAPLIVRERREFSVCGQCALIFQSEGPVLSKTDERARYELHRYDPADSGYREFLTTAIAPLMSHLKPNSRGLDYGCGRSPAIQSMVQEFGHEVVNYDPHFWPGDPAERAPFDFVICTEAAEHFTAPREEFDTIFSLLSPRGVVSLMTSTWSEETDLAEWWYMRDPTHLVFYHHTTFRWIAETYQMKLLIPHVNVALFSANTGSVTP